MAIDVKKGFAEAKARQSTIERLKQSISRGKRENEARIFRGVNEASSSFKALQKRQRQENLKAAAKRRIVKQKKDRPSISRGIGRVVGTVVRPIARIGDKLTEGISRGLSRRTR